MISNSAKILNVLEYPCEIITADFNSSPFDRHFHHTFSIGFITKGMNTFSYRGQTINVPTGAVCIADPGEVHDGGLAGMPWSYINIFVPISLFKDLNIEEETHRQVVFQTGGISNYKSCLLVSSLLKALLSNHNDQLRIDELAILTFNHLLNNHIVDSIQNTKKPEGSPIAKRALEMINDFKGKEVSLTLLGKEIGVSRYSVIRAVYSSIGLTPVSYMIQLRVEHAKSLIVNGMPIAEAAVETGFSDQPHLTREMKRRLGVTPGKFKP